MCKNVHTNIFEIVAMILVIPTTNATTVFPFMNYDTMTEIG